MSLRLPARLQDKTYQNTKERERNAGAATVHDGGDAPRRGISRSVTLLSSIDEGRVVHQAGGDSVHGEHHARSAVVLRISLLAVDPDGVRLQCKGEMRSQIAAKG